MFSPRKASRIPFPPTMVCAIASSLGIFLVIFLQSLVVPDVGLLDDYNKENYRASAESFLSQHNGGRLPPSRIEIQTAFVDAVVARELRQRFSSKEVTELITQKQLPVVSGYVTWVRTGGTVAAQVAISPFGDVVSYLNAEVPVVPLSADALTPAGQGRAEAVARSFLGSGTRVNPMGFGAPTVGRVTGGAEEVEVLWRRPAPGVEKYLEVVVVRLRGGTVWFYQHRIEPERTPDLLPIIVSQFRPLLLAVPNVVLMFIAALYLAGMYQKQELFWRPALTLVIVVCLLTLVQTILTLPFSLSKSVLQGTVQNASPNLLASRTQNGLLWFSMIGTGIVMVAMLVISAISMGIGFSTILHLEADNRRGFTETLRGILAFKHVPYNRLIKSSLTGGGVGWALLGVICIIRFFQGAPSVYAEETNVQLMFDSWSPNFFLIGTVLRTVLQDGILHLGFVWVMLTDRFRVPVKFALPIMAVWGGLGWTSLTNLIFLESSVKWHTLLANAFISVVLVALMERHGLWTMMLAIWSFQFTEAILLGATVPAFGISPWLMTVMLVLPSIVLVLPFKKPEPEKTTELAPTLLDRFVEEQRYEQQLAIAARIQSDFLPKHTPRFDGWDIAVRSLPAREVGGDFYDFIQLKQGLTGIMVGDISGKSVPGALFMAVATTTFHSEAEECDAGCAPLLERLNQLLYADMKRVRMFAAATYALFNPETGDMTISNAALPCPLLFRKAEDRSEYLDLNGLPLGSMRISRYLEGEVRLETGDVLVMSSDGVVEALDENDQMFGYDRLAALVTDHSTQSSARLIETILEAVRDHAGDAEQSDDITVLVLKKV